MSRTQRLFVVLVLNLTLVASLIAVGVTAHSLAVLAEGGDYLLDAAGVGVALLAIHLAARPATELTVRVMLKNGTCPSRRSSWTPPQMPPQQRVWPQRAG